jgi:uncharacterized protein YjgD (DUF1641 family)
MKSTKAEIHQRILTIVKLLLQSTPYSSVVQYGAETWGLHSRQMAKYINQANKKIKAMADKQAATHYDLTIEKLGRWEMKALKDEDVRLALEIAKEKSKILGLYEAQKFKIETVLKFDHAEEANI